MSVRTIGDYRLTEPLGRGAMGVVWRAVHIRRGVRAAVKTLPRGHSKRTVAALQREVLAIGRLDHPHVVALYDQGTTDGEPWLAMELAHGTLQAPRSWTQLRRVLDEVLSGLAAAHAVGMLHLDLKPSNVLVRDGRHLLADFGISHGLSAVEERGVWGSPGFMAPEAFDGRPERLSRATDLYSAGCLAWTLATGRPPFGGTPRDLADAHRTLEPPPLVPRIPVPPGFEDWARQLLCKRPTERFQSASGARRALASLPAAGIEATEEASLSLGPTLTTCTARHAMTMAELEPRQEPPAAPSCPASWPPSPPIDGWTRGCGLVGLLAVPWLDRPSPQAVLWQALRDTYDGQPRHVRLGGVPGSGRSRLLRRFLSEAHRHAGAEPLLVDGPLRRSLQRTFGADAETLALRAARRVQEVEPLVEQLSADPLAALRRLPEILRTPLVVGVDGGEPVRLDGWPGLVVEVVDGPGDLTLRPFGDKPTRRLLAAWASLDPQAVADVCDRTEGDLAASVDLVAEGIRDGSFAQSERGWRPLHPEAMAVPTARLAQWADAVARLRAELPDEALRQVVVLREPGADATEELASTLKAMERAGWLHDGGWVSSMGRMALAAALGDLTEEHLSAAQQLEGWDRGEHLLEAGAIEEASHVLLDTAWRATAQGRMSRVQAVLRRLEGRMGHVPATDPRWGLLHTGLARLGPTHQGYAASADRAHRALELARSNAYREGWTDVARNAIGHLLFHADIRLHPRGTQTLIDAFRELTDDHARANDLAAWIHLREGDAWRAMRASFQAGEQARRTGSSYRVMVSRLLYWIAAHNAGHPQAVERYAHHVQAFLDAGYLSAEMDAAVCLGDMHRRDGRLEEAADDYDHALRVAAEGEARADVGPFLGAALCQRALGHPRRAVDLLRAARAQLRDAGTSWSALIDLYEAWARSDAGAPVDPDVVTRAVATLEESGYLHADVLDAYAALEQAGIAASAVAAARHRGARAIQAFRDADALRGPMPSYPCDNP